MVKANVEITKKIILELSEDEVNFLLSAINNAQYPDEDEEAMWEKTKRDMVKSLETTKLNIWEDKNE